MAVTPRKTLGLPTTGRSQEAAADNPRRPVRGGAAFVKRRPASDESLIRPPQAAKAPSQQKPRGTPSRAPVVAKTSPARPLSAPVLDKTPQSGVRVSKLMAERGLCSRREADSYIERGWVFVNGERLTELGTRADPSVTIKLDKGARAAQQQQMTILLHKPVGYVSGQPEPGFTPAVTLVQPENQYRTPDTPLFHASHLKGLAPAGRLDIDSTGLLVLTQDGRVARQLIGENSTVDKEYLVRVEGRLDARGLALLNHGLSLDERKLKPAKVEWLNEDQLRFVLNEGRKRQIRRMCELVGLRAVGLKRVRIGKVKLADLPLGQWRFLRDDETF
ncbi:pseudouridine synthase [Propionivibrio sp.]|uniref:pseudouridine synthase n=1 Tax=Propionivibrio sp. TaxID=2212460 RepID=UPI003BF1E0BD